MADDSARGAILFGPEDSFRLRVPRRTLTRYIVSHDCGFERSFRSLRVTVVCVALGGLVMGCARTEREPATPSAVPSTLAALATITPVTTNATPTMAPPPSVVVKGTGRDGLILRPAPGSAERLAILAEGTTLQVSGSQQEANGRAWINVTTGEGQSGWVASEFVGAA